MNRSAFLPPSSAPGLAEGAAAEMPALTPGARAGDGAADAPDAADDAATRPLAPLSPLADGAPGEPDARFNDRRDLVEAAEARMLRLLPRRLNVPAFAAEHGLTARQMEHLFEEVRGASSYRVFLLRRLKRVEELAAERRVPLAVASTLCGFGHSGVFRRAFLAAFDREPEDPFGVARRTRRRRDPGAGSA